MWLLAPRGSVKESSGSLVVESAGNFLIYGGGGGTPIHYLYRYVPPNGVVIIEAPDLERGRYNTSNARKLQFYKQPFEIIQWQIAFTNTV